MVANSRLILASASPRRRELLHAAGYDFEVHPADIDEDDYPSTILPADLAVRLAQLKASAAAEKFPEHVVLAADTVVALGDRPLGKPADDLEAAKMLELLSGTTHIVITGVALMHRAGNLARSLRVMSAVRMKMLSPGEIRKYVESGQWQGKAGGYGIQDDHHDPFVRRIAGSHSNIVGLPMERTIELLSAAGVHPARQADDAHATVQAGSADAVTAPAATMMPQEIVPAEPDLVAQENAPQSVEPDRAPLATEPVESPPARVSSPRPERQQW